MISLPRAILAALLLGGAPSLFAAPVSPKIPALFRGGQAQFRAVTTLPPDVSSKLFGGEIVGDTFNLFLRDLKAQPLKIEIGFVDTESTAPQQRTFSLSANGTPLDASLDVFTEAGGANKPWVMKTTFNHAGGALALQFAGLSKPAFVSYVRLIDAAGQELAFGTAQDWQKAERLTLLDSRFRPFRRVAVGEVPFFNVDHSPVGTWSTLIYGMTASGGVQVCKQPGGDGTLIPHYGLIVAVKNGDAERVMPFACGQPPAVEKMFVSAAEVKRTLGACTDAWQLPMGVSWTHYTPVWAMKDWETATASEKRRFVLPVTWMQYRIDNRAGKNDTQLLFSLQQPAVRAKTLKGFSGYVVDGDTTIAVKNGDADLLTAAEAEKTFGVKGATSAFRVTVPPGQEKIVTFYISQSKPGVIAQLEDKPLQLMSSALYAGIDEVLETAAESLPAVIERCQAVDRQLADCGQNAERRFLAGDALHSYQFNTVLYATKDRQPIWTVIEGECSFINTFDLAVDQVFYELAMHPWTVRNELDLYVDPYSFIDELSLPGQSQRFPGGIGFGHDIGSQLKFSTREQGAAYPRLMTQEELQNWIICAALYWKTTGDNVWLKGKEDIFAQALKSMQRRDDIDPAKRDGITTYTSSWGDRSGEITTYDAMDASLKHPIDSLYITGKSLACYAMLRPVFRQLGKAELAEQAEAAEKYTVKGLLSHWDAGTRSFPANFDGRARSSIIPAIEGLGYIHAMGLADDVSFTGPNGELMKNYRTHMQTVLVPGLCIDAETGAWNLSSSSATTWLSKVYFNQYVAENVLGLKSDVTGKTADEAAYAYEVLGAPAVGWTDQFYTSTHIAYGCRHYPRGVTSALWWLWPPAPPTKK